MHLLMRAFISGPYNATPTANDPGAMFCMTYRYICLSLPNASMQRHDLLSRLAGSLRLLVPCKCFQQLAFTMSESAHAWQSKPGDMLAWHAQLSLILIKEARPLSRPRVLLTILLRGRSSCTMRSLSNSARQNQSGPHEQTGL